MFRRTAILTLALVAFAVASAHAAHFRGKSVDGRWFSGDLHHPDFGTYRNVDVRFDGDHVMIGIPGGGQLNCHLEDEAILDAHEIPCQDYRRGIVWTLSVDGLGR